MADSNQLWLITEAETVVETVEPGQRSGDDVGGGFGPARGPAQVIEQVKIVRQRVPLDAVALKVQMQGLLQVVGDVFDQANQQSGLQLDQVELAVEINAEGQVSLLGSGGKLADRGAIKLMFKRK